MKLTYRGVQYNHTPAAVDTAVTDETGKFRGVDIRFRTLKKSPTQQPTLDLVYRGVAYTTGQHEPEPAVTSNSDKSGTESKARAMMMAHHRTVKNRQQSMLGRLAAEIGLPADAARHWNHIQGKVHPSFWATYDRSRSASS
ncbi:hypothetical protein C7271_14390 [filamentous cyanobacterium CCP5]|nr:hypothetical protein C7271_14390 [filamentous cyanobacterium CCP5]